jgi:hypothetical protein
MTNDAVMCLAVCSRVLVMQTMLKVLCIAICCGVFAAYLWLAIAMTLMLPTVNDALCNQPAFLWNTPHSRNPLCVLEQFGIPRGFACLHYCMLCCAVLLHQADVEAVVSMCTADNIDQLLAGQPDYVLDAIDNIHTKVRGTTAQQHGAGVASRACHP